MMNGMYMNDMAWWFGALADDAAGCGGDRAAVLEDLCQGGLFRWLGLLMIVPMVNLIALYVLAFSEWPRSKRADKLDSG